MAAGASMGEFMCKLVRNERVSLWRLAQSSWMTVEWDRLPSF